MPALAAWTAFLLCRYLTGRTLPLPRRRLPVRLLELCPERRAPRTSTPQPYSSCRSSRCSCFAVTTETWPARTFVVLLALVLAWQAAPIHRSSFHGHTRAHFRRHPRRPRYSFGRRARGSVRLVLPLALSYGVAALLVSPLAVLHRHLPRRRLRTRALGVQRRPAQLRRADACERRRLVDRRTGKPLPGQRHRTGCLPRRCLLLLILAWYWLANRRKPVARFLLVLFLAAAVADPRVVADGRWPPRRSASLDRRRGTPALRERDAGPVLRVLRVGSPR